MKEIHRQTLFLRNLVLDKKTRKNRVKTLLALTLLRILAVAVVMVRDKVLATAVVKVLVQVAVVAAAMARGKEQALVTVLVPGLEQAAAEAMLAVQLRFRLQYHQGLYRTRNQIIRAAREAPVLKELQLCVCLSVLTVA